MSKSQFDIAVFPGDGIGVEITPITLDLIAAACEKYNVQCNFINLDAGAAYYQKHGVALPAEAMVTKSIVLTGPVPPANTPLVEEEQDATPSPRTELKSPKSVAFPAEAIVINPITLVYPGMVLLNPPP